ncbi:protein FAM104A-like isoform X1 [Anguilla anguilla]|uniref:protein FAM104A-like isoform X1 n=1 Tax=Anguilla anguilla TaxID=7936 RepID=UPI0015B19D63|nr:protein FAM104A-like isoform X1 [Anguilla anguilla]
MLTESRKRRLSCGSEDGQVPPSAKRSGGGQSELTELGREVWDSESSSSDSSAVSSPEWPAGGSTVQGADIGGRSHSSPSPTNPAPLPEEWAPIGQSNLGASYNHINRILREAHFSSLQTRSHAHAT